MVQDIEISFAPYNKIMSQVSEAKLCNPKFRGSPRMSALETGTPDNSDDNDSRN